MNVPADVAVHEAIERFRISYHSRIAKHGDRTAHPLQFASCAIEVLGLVTMDDLLAQIFGVLRDERAALQQQPNQKRMRTPVGGVDTGQVPKDIDTGQVPKDIDTGPVGREDVEPAVTPMAVDVDDLRAAPEEKS